MSKILCCPYEPVTVRSSNMSREDLDALILKGAEDFDELHGPCFLRRDCSSSTIGTEDTISQHVLQNLSDARTHKPTKNYTHMNRPLVQNRWRIQRCCCVQ